MNRKIWAWVIFLACLLVLSMGATAYSSLANTLLVGARLALLAALSVLTVRAWWRLRQGTNDKWQNLRADAGDRFLQRVRGWYYGEPKNLH
jgi:hypothetical protein